MTDRHEPPATSQSGGSDDLPSSSKPNPSHLPPSEPIPDPIDEFFSAAVEEFSGLYSPRHLSVVKYLEREFGNATTPENVWNILNRNAWTDEGLLRFQAARRALGDDAHALDTSTVLPPLQVGDEIVTWLAIVDRRYDATVLAPLYLDEMGPNTSRAVTAAPDYGHSVEVLHTDCRHPVAALVLYTLPNLIDGTFEIRPEYRFTPDALPALGENLLLALQTKHGDSLLLREVQRVMGQAAEVWLMGLATTEIGREHYGDDVDQRGDIQRLKRRPDYRGGHQDSETPEQRIARYSRELITNGWNRVEGIVGKPFLGEAGDVLSVTLKVVGLPTHPMRASTEIPRAKLVRFTAALDKPDCGRLVVGRSEPV